MDILNKNWIIHFKNSFKWILSSFDRPSEKSQILEDKVTKCYFHLFT
jgi:hypothetical protein